MSGRWQKLMPAGLLLMVATCLGGYSLLLTQRLETAQLRLREQQKTLALQAGTIGTLQAQDMQNRVLIATQLQQEQQLRQQYDDTQRKYRDAIKHDACARQSMPDAVLELLQPTAATGLAAVNPAAS